MKKLTQIVGFIFLSLCVFTSCTLPQAPSPSTTDLDATAVKQTVEALNNQEDSSNTVNSPSQNNSDDANYQASPEATNVSSGQNASSNQPTPQSTATQQPTPTKKPTQATKNNQSTQPLDIGTPDFIPVDVYYGFCGANDPTTIVVSLPIKPIDQIDTVVLWYEFGSQNGSWGPYWQNMIPVQGDEFSAVIDIGVDGPMTLGSTDGWVDYWVEVTRKDGTPYIGPAYSASVVYCPPGSIGSPATMPVINFFTGPWEVAPNETVTVSWEVFDAACGVYLDGMTVNASDSYSYTVPAQGAVDQYDHQLVAQGEPCANPNISTESITIKVNKPQVPDAPYDFKFVEWTEGPTANFSWGFNAYTSEANGFHIWDDTTLIQTVSADTLQWSIVLHGYCGQKKNYRVSAYNSIGESEYTEWAVIDGYCEPDPPSINKFGDEYDDYNDRFYISVPNAKYHNVYVDGVLIYEMRDINTPGNMQYTPACGETVYVWVTAVNFAGESSSSNYLKIIGTCP